MAQAFLLGLDYTSITFDAFNIMAEIPFSTEEFDQWSKKPHSFLEERYRGVTRLVEEQGADFEELCECGGLLTGPSRRPSACLATSPRYNFPEFFEALQREDRAHYPYANLPWWGV